MWHLLAETKENGAHIGRGTSDAAALGIANRDKEKEANSARGMSDAAASPPRAFSLVLMCDDARDAVLLVGALRALTNPSSIKCRAERSKSGAIVDESRAGAHDDLMRVPGKPLGFLAASTIEYHPARPEAHRSTVLGSQKLYSSRHPKPREPASRWYPHWRSGTPSPSRHSMFE